jgi:hypothetical protein
MHGLSSGAKRLGLLAVALFYMLGNARAAGGVVQPADEPGVAGPETGVEAPAPSAPAEEQPPREAEEPPGEDPAEPANEEPEQGEEDDVGEDVEGAGQEEVGEDAEGAGQEEVGEDAEGAEAQVQEAEQAGDAAQKTEVTVGKTKTAPKSRAEKKSLTLFGLPLRARIEPRFRARWAPDDAADRDLYGLVMGELGDSRRNHVAVAALGRLAWDMGIGEDQVDDSLKGLDDTRGPVFFRLYHAYLEASRLGPLMFLRAGRLYLEETPEWVHVDGGHVRSALEKKQRVYVEAYGGSPVHIYQGERSGDVVTGGALGSRLWKGARLRADYMYLQDQNYAPGQSNHLYGPSLWQWFGPSLVLYAAGHGLDNRPRDIRARASMFHEKLGLNAQLAYFQLLSTRRRIALSGDRLTGVLYDEREFWQIRGLVEKSIGPHVAIGGGADARTLVDADDSSPLNRTAQRYWLGPRFREFPKSFDAGLTGEFWYSGGEQGGNVLTVGADASYMIRRAARFRLATDYARYRYDFYLGQERLDSRRFIASAEGWMRRWGLKAGVQYELESALEGIFHTLWATLGVSL